MVGTSSPEVIRTLCECALNVLKGNVPLTAHQKTKLRKHKKRLRTLVNKKVSLKKKRSVLQTGGFLGVLLKPVLSVLGGLLGGG